MLADADRFRQRLGSLARLALSVAVQKRDRIRQQARADTALRRGFLLDRARLVVVPVGLDEAAEGCTRTGDWATAARRWNWAGRFSSGLRRRCTTAAAAAAGDVPGWAARPGVG